MLPIEFATMQFRRFSSPGFSFKVESGLILLLAILIGNDMRYYNHTNAQFQTLMSVSAKTDFNRV